jgi:hypothetical protein
MKAEKTFKFRKLTIYIQYFFYHFGLAIDYERYATYYNISILLPFVLIAFEIPIKKSV